MFYLGVDGGGTKTVFSLINNDGKLLAQIRTKNIDYLRIGSEIFKNRLKTGVSSVCDQADIEINDISYSILGIPGCGDEIRSDNEVLEDIMTTIFSAGEYECVNDAKVGWAGSLACQPGVNLVAGTGTIGFGKDNNGNEARASGWGYFCGDEGSAYWLGKKVLSLFTKEADGREAKSPLYEIVQDEFNLNRDFDLISVIDNKLKQKRDKIAQLALLLYRAAEQGDKRAVKIYKEAAYEFSLTVNTIIDKLEFEKGESILVSYSGGVFKAGDYVLTPFRNYLAGENIRLIKPILEPSVGAAVIALKADWGYEDYSQLELDLEGV